MSASSRRGKEVRAGVSVIICCYNSALLLPQTIKHLLAQITLGIEWEIIIVNNNSTDNTTAVAKSELANTLSNISYKIINEPNPGLSNARKAGYENATYELIVYCDDDNWLEKNYLQHAYNIMQENQNVGILGGRSIGAFETSKPAWFDNFQWAYAIGNQLEKTGIANSRRYITGAGMVIRRKILEKLRSLNFKPVLSDRKGDSVTSGGDSELCILCRYLGYDLYYDERLQFTHYITSNRLQWSYCVRMISEGFTVPQIYYYLYEYCYDQINQNKKPSFSYAYKRNLRKPFKEIVANFNSITKGLSSVKLLLKSTPGSMEGIKLKAKINKLTFALRNKKLLKEDFAAICEFLRRLKLSVNN